MFSVCVGVFDFGLAKERQGQVLNSGEVSLTSQVFDHDRLGQLQ
ncbi:MAG: hypothetical protein O2839_00625 [Cyanobacteria bacterium]|nr:hypothetical protein [Cyanobacteriota bacterium]MDA1245703.1 hypothetical protein [Cyanobacteriota bacterium]